MIRKTTAAALVLSAVPAALAMTLFAGTATGRRRHPVGPGTSAVTPLEPDRRRHPVAISRRRHWHDDDTPWGRSITLPALPVDDTPWDDDTPWG